MDFIYKKRETGSWDFSNALHLYYIPCTTIHSTRNFKTCHIEPATILNPTAVASQASTLQSTVAPSFPADQSSMSHAQTFIPSELPPQSFPQPYQLSPSAFPTAQSLLGGSSVPPSYGLPPGSMYPPQPSHATPRSASMSSVPSSNQWATDRFAVQNTRYFSSSGKEITQADVLHVESWLKHLEQEYHQCWTLYNALMIGHRNGSQPLKNLYRLLPIWGAASDFFLSRQSNKLKYIEKACQRQLEKIHTRTGELQKQANDEPHKFNWTKVPKRKSSYSVNEGSYVVLNKISRNSGIEVTVAGSAGTSTILGLPKEQAMLPPINFR